MINIKSFEMFEGYSFPNSMIPLNDWLENFIISKFRWWVGRKRLYNYVENFVFYPDDIDIPKNDDFPFSRFKLKIAFRVNSSEHWQGKGLAYFFKDQRQFDIDCVQSEYNRGRIIPSMEIHFTSNKNVIEVQEIIENIKITLRHEILHLYQFYKRKKNGVDHCLGSMGHALIETWTTIGPGKLSDLLYMAYFMTDKDEYSAKLSEYTLDIPHTRGHLSKEDYMNILNTSKDEYIDSIISDLDDDPELVPKIFLKHYMESWPTRYLNKRIIDQCIDFETFINFMYDETKKKIPNLLKKINKIKFSKRK